MTREQKVRMLATQKCNWVLGGYENAICDGHMVDMPNAGMIKAEIYEAMMDEQYIDNGYTLIDVKKDIRFMGREAIWNIIEETYESLK